VNLQAKPVSGSGTDMTWVYTKPATQNVPHTTGQSTSNTNSQTESVSLGFSGTSLTGGISFSATQSTTIGYTVQTTITDWSVYEQSDGVPSPGFGQWQYDETWPVNNQNDNWNNFGSTWPSFYSTSSCAVQTPPALSTESQQTSSSIMWRADTALLDSNHSMPIEFAFKMEFEQYRLWCPVCCSGSEPCNPCADGGCSSGKGSSHHCLESEYPYYDETWQIDAAALNNLVSATLPKVFTAIV